MSSIIVFRWTTPIQTYQANENIYEPSTPNLKRSTPQNESEKLHLLFVFSGICLRCHSDQYLIGHCITFLNGTADYRQRTRTILGE